MTQEDKDDLDIKAKFKAYYEGLQIRKDSEYLEYEAEEAIAEWEELMKARLEIANKNFLLELAETRLHIMTNGKKIPNGYDLNGGVL